MVAAAANPQGNDPAKKPEAVDLLASVANGNEMSMNAFVQCGEMMEGNDVVEDIDLDRWASDGGFVPPEL